MGMGNGCYWDERTCSDAAQNGNLDILQWARANGCRWDARTHVFEGCAERAFGDVAMGPG